jgi:hypothetical protein
MPKDKQDDLTFDTEPEKPAAKAGEAGYDWAADYPGVDNLYSHTFPDGTVVALKPFSSIYSKTWLYKLRALQTDVDIEFAALDRGACDAARRVLSNLPDTDGDPLDDLFKAWAASATEGLTPGE